MHTANANPPLGSSSIFSLTNLENAQLQGYGRIELNNIMSTSSAEPRTFVLCAESQSLSAGSSFAVSYAITSSSNRVAITMAYTDYPPSSIGAGQSNALVSNLDLTVYSGTPTNDTLLQFGNQLFGWVSCVQ